MCGIAGYVGDDRTAHNGLGIALDLLRHRGPNDRGAHVRGPVSLGMTRLSIIDVECGHQPIYNEDGTIAVVFNGEIYNFRQLGEDLRRRGHTLATASDTEVLVHLYEEYGSGMVTHLRGMFAFAIHDARTQSVFLGRDRFGKKPLYYLHDGSQMWFASELKALRGWVRDSGPAWAVDPQAVYDYLSLGVVPQPSTIYRGVSTLPAGSHARFINGALEVQQYWAPSFLPKTSMDLDEATLETRRLVNEAVGLRLRSDVPLGVFLSGGVDSSVVAYEAGRALDGDLDTFTVSTGGDLDESRQAQHTARHLGVRNTTLDLTLDAVEGVQSVVATYDQPYADSSAVPSMQIAKMASEHVSVVLNGDGGDEIFGGYRRHVAARRLQRMSVIPGRLARGAASALGSLGSSRRSPVGLATRFARGMGLSPQERYLVFTNDLLREADKREIWRGDPQLPTERLVRGAQDSRLSFIDQQMLNDIHLNLVSDLLVKMDMACMATSLEARSPFLDQDLAAFAFTLPDNLRVRGGRSKVVLKEAYRGLIPDRVLDGAKMGFEVPLQRWLDHDLRELTRDTLLASDARILNYVEPDFVAGLGAGRVFTDRNTIYLQYSALILELWLRRHETWVA